MPKCKSVHLCWDLNPEHRIRSPMCYPITPQRLSFKLTSAHIEDVQWVSIAVMADIFYNTNYKMIIQRSTKNDKRLMANFGKRPNGKEYIVHFGSPSPPSEAFIDHGDEKKRDIILNVISPEKIGKTHFLQERYLDTFFGKPRILIKI